MFAPPSAPFNFFKCAPTNLKSWMSTSNLFIDLDNVSFYSHAWQRVTFFTGTLFLVQSFTWFLMHICW
jgi:hypothetical protein